VGQSCPSSDPIETLFEPDFTYQDFYSIKQRSYDLDGVMRKSIIETQKLFQIEDLKDGQVNIETSEYLLSLKEEEQIKVLTVHLSKLKNDLAILEDPALKNSIAKSDEVEKAQLQLLINIIENLLSQI
jgi:hypothetical protein